MNPVEDSLEALPVILQDNWGGYVALRVEQRDALVRLVAATRGDGFYEELLRRCDEASDPVVGAPSVHDIVAAARAAFGGKA